MDDDNDGEQIKKRHSNWKHDVEMNNDTSWKVGGEGQKMLICARVS